MSKEVLGKNYKELKENNFAGTSPNKFFLDEEKELENNYKANTLIIVEDELKQCKLLSETNIEILISNLKHRLESGLIHREENDNE